MGATADARGADIGLASTAAQLQQQTNLANPDAGTRVDLANQNALNARAIEQARLSQQTNLANQDAGMRADLSNQAATNARAIQQAQLIQQSRLANQDAGLRTSLANQAAGNQFTLAQFGADLDVNKFNAQAYNTNALQNAQFQQQTGLQANDIEAARAIQNAQLAMRGQEFNANAANQVNLQQGQLDASLAQFNTGQTNDMARFGTDAALRQQQLNDARAIENYQLALQNQGQLLNYYTGERNAAIEAEKARNAETAGWLDMATDAADLYVRYKTGGATGVK